MERRAFFKRLLGGFAVAAAVPFLPEYKPVIKSQFAEHMKPGLRRIIGTRLRHQEYGMGFRIEEEAYNDDLYQKFAGTYRWTKRA